jgi:GNAT superfamily N-acetyltransferase
VSPPNDAPLAIAPARWPQDAEAVRTLFRDYAAWLQVDLCFQGFESELAGLPGAYAGPAGGVWLLRATGAHPVGCVGLRPLDAGRCELKRLWVAAPARGAGWGRRLSEAALAHARSYGYRTAVLDTLPRLTAAVTLYRSMGFRPIPHYADPGPQETVAFGLDLAAPQASETRAG